MLRRGLLIALCIASFAMATGVWAVDSTSTNFQNNSSAFSPTTFDATSPNFRLNASVDSIVGVAESANFGIVSGVRLREPDVTPPSLPPGSTGSGGLGATSTQQIPASLPVQESIPVPTLEYQPFTFRPTQVVHGTRPAGLLVRVNGSSEGVEYPDATHWQREIPLLLGLNLVTVQAVSADGVGSQVIGGQIQRALIGDVNRDQIVDDIDLSMFTRATKKYTIFSDFNEDKSVDVLDLSLIASHWLQTFGL